MSQVEIKRPGSDKWETSADMGGSVPLKDCVGALVKYPTGGDPIVMKVTGLSEPDANGTRKLLMEVNTGE